MTTGSVAGSTPSRPRLRSLLPAAVLCLGLGPALAACSDSSDTSAGSEAGSPTTSAAPAPSGSSTGSSDAASESGSGSGSGTAAYLPVPDGVELTAQGSTLDLGDHAVVAYEPRQGKVGVLDIRVDSAQSTSFKRSFQGWQLDKRTLRTNPYFVHVRVKNVGDTDLGGRPVPLYIVDGNDTLIEASTFASRYEPCPSTPFPKRFRHGDRVDTCLVYFAPRHGDLTAVSFRPTQDFDPITWTGEVRALGEATGGKPGKPRKPRKPGDAG